MAGDPIGTKEEIDAGVIDICFDNGRCRNGVCEQYCEFNNQISCMCTDPDTVVSLNL